MNDLETVESGSCARHGPFIGRCGACRSEKIAEQEAQRVASERAQRTRDLLARADLPERFVGCTLDGYAPRTAKQRRALEVCERYVDELDARVSRGRSLVLVGPIGVGKTHLLVSIAVEAIVRGVSTRYTTAESLVAAWGTDGVDKRGGFGNWVDVRPLFAWPRLLVLDELFVPTSAKDGAALLAVIDERYRRRLPTLVASNLDWDEMKTHVGERFCDRLLEGGDVIAMDGKSARGP